MEQNQWSDIIKTLGVTCIYGITFAIAVYKGFIYWVDRQVKTDTSFIDTRVDLKYKEHREEQDRKIEKNSDRIEQIERDYKTLNEERIKELKLFLKDYK